MKENAIEKINKMGKVCSIVALICKIFVIVGIVGILIGGIAFVVLPDDFLKMQLSGQAAIEVNLKAFDFVISDEIEEKIKKEVNSSDIDVNGVSYEASAVDVKDNSIFIDASADTYTITFGSFIWVMIICGITLVLTLVSIQYVGKLCKAFSECTSPFDETVIKNMQKFAFSLIPWTLFSSITEMVTESLFTNNFTLILGIDLGMVFVVLIIFALVYIFKYGAILQQESDETL